MSFLHIEAIHPDEGWTEYSYFRSNDVGVGGKYSFGPFAGGSVRRATQAELRHLDHCQILRIRAEYPEHILRFRRSR